MTDIKGKVAVVTGGTSGIGHAIAEELARGGVRVFVTGLGSEEQINEALERIEAGAEVAPQHDPADMRDAGEVRDMIGRVAEAAGAVDILVNNAGVQHTARVEEFPQERWDEIIAVNLSAAFHASAAALPGMQERDYGRIINISSVHGLVASVEKAAYVSAKHGIIGLTRVTALENAEANITCNAICPGWVLTPLIQAQIEKRAEKMGVDMEAAARDLLLEKEPSLRFTRIEDIAGAVMFMLSPAGDNMTGSCLMLDGGWTAR